MNTLASVVKLHPRKKLEEVLAVTADDVSRFKFLGSGIESCSCCRMIHQKLMAQPLDERETPAHKGIEKPF